MNQLDKYKKTINYKPCRILYYNSCRYTFFETHLDKNTILFGNNNAGKTSFLNGLQFFLLPEINFSNIDSKFNFKKKYTSEDSYKYYFPTSHSFIIAEFENAFGRFLQIIFAGRNQLEYNRIFTKARYEDIRELLWDSSINEVKEINGSDFIAHLKTTNKAAFVNKKKDIIDLIYSNDINKEENGRYAIVPINPSNFKFENMKSIVKLAFNIDILNEEDLKHIFINYIEGNFKNLEDVANFDFSKLCQEQEDYKIERSHHILIKNHKALYEDCLINLNTMLDLTPKIVGNFNDYFHFYLREMVRISDELTKLNNSANYFEKHVTDSKDKVKDQRKVVSDSEAVIKNKKSDIDKEKSNFERFKKVIKDHGLGEHSHYETNTYFNEKINTLKSDLEIINDKEKLNLEISRLKRQILDVQKNNDEILALIEDKTDPRLVINQLPEGSREFYRNVFKSVFDVEYTLDEKEKTALAAFFDIVNFNKENSTYSIFGRFVCRTSDKFDIEKAQKELKENEEKLVKLKENLAEKTTYLSNDISKNKDKINNDLLKLQSDLGIFIRHAEVETVLEEMTAELVVGEQSIIEKKEILKKFEDEHSRYVNDLQMKKDAIEQIQKDERVLKERYQGIELKAATVGFNTNIEVDATYVVKTTKLTQEMVDELINDFVQSSTCKSNLKRDLKVFVNDNIIEDTDNKIIASDCSANEMKNILRNEIQPLYEHLDEKIQNLTNSMRSSFAQAYSQSERINDYRNHIRACIKKFNKQLADTTVSNFDYISVDLVFDLRFDDFTDTFKSTDAHNPTEENIDDFFVKLRQFLDRFNITNKITTRDILKSVGIQYHKDDIIEKKAQSNGTGIMANSVILSQLKNEFVQGDSERSVFNYYLPIIVDEVSNIDVFNLKTLKNFLAEKEFIMFCATPSPSISVDDNYDVMISLSSHVKHKIFDENRKIVHFLPENISIEKIDSLNEDWGDVEDGVPINA